MRLKSEMIRLLTPLAALTIGVTANADTSLEVERACKPVVPQVVVQFTNYAEFAGRSSLTVRYSEAGGEPYSHEILAKASSRYSGCEVKNGRCISSRMRYENCLEGLRDQSIQLLKGGEWSKEGEGDVLGGVQWFGPSYPDRVSITCDLSLSDPRTICTLDSVEYSPNFATSGDDGQKPLVSRHDQCKPSEAQQATV